jgi:hypothetical protein
MKAGHFSETLVNVYQTERRHIIMEAVLEHRTLREIFVSEGENVRRYE